MNISFISRCKITDFFNICKFFEQKVHFFSKSAVIYNKNNSYRQQRECATPSLLLNALLNANL